MIPISRTIGGDRLVDEFVACFTHDKENDTLLPGIKPTGKPVRIPMVGRLFNFVVTSCAASTSIGIRPQSRFSQGLLNPKELPVTGAEAADKVLDEELPLNTLRADQWWTRSEGR